MRQFLVLLLLIGLTFASTASAGHTIPLLTLDDWSVDGGQHGADFGYSAATAGDVNGDGYADVIIGAPLYDVEGNSVQNEGAVFVYHGSSAGLGDDPDLTIAGENKGSRFGWSVSTAGDVNGDTYDDVIVGAHLYGQPETGRAYVFFGSYSGLSDTPDWTFELDGQPNANFGISVGTAGNVNGDAYDDIIIGASGYLTGGLRMGAAFVFYGSASGPITTTCWMTESNQAAAQFGASVGTAGDVNGDSYDDVIVGAPEYDNDGIDDNEGAAFVFYGSDSGLGSSHDWLVYGNQDEAEFGASVGMAGDVNNDGYADVVIGAPHYGNGQVNGGAAFVFHGSDAGLSENVDWMVASDQDWSRLGVFVNTAGNVNGGDYADVIVGAPLYQDGERDEGVAFVFRGSVGGLLSMASWSAGGDKAETEFGTAVSTAGDVDGDGYDDVIIGAPEFKTDTDPHGRVLVHHGSEAADIEFFSYLPLVLKAFP